MMGNSCCAEECSCSNCIPVRRFRRPKLLEFLRMPDCDSNAVRLLLDRRGCDGIRQQQADLIRHRQKIDGRSNSISESHQDFEKRSRSGEVFLGHSGLQIYVVTWNMNGKIPESNLGKLLDPLPGSRYDMYVIGLQEAPNCYIESIFLDILGEGYCLVASSLMSSLQLFVFARITLLPFITDPKCDRVGVGGFGGVVGRQKGAVAISFRYREYSFLFLSAHLAPHEGNVEARNAQFFRICQSVFVKPSTIRVCSPCLLSNGVVESVLNHEHYPYGNSVEASDLVIWVGDLNYRVAGHRSSVGVLIKNDLEKLLWPKDQLLREVKHGRVFNGFTEGPLTFRPTYKYDIGTDDYDTSAKERVPSWTDRILFKVRRKSWLTAAVQDYSSIDSLKCSDHRPVKGILKVEMVI